MDRNPEKRKIQDSESAESKKTRQDEAAILERFRANFDSYLNQDPDFKSDLLEVLKKKEQRDKDAHGAASSSSQPMVAPVAQRAEPINAQPPGVSLDQLIFLLANQQQMGLASYGVINGYAQPMAQGAEPLVQPKFEPYLQSLQQSVARIAQPQAQPQAPPLYQMLQQPVAQAAEPIAQPRAQPPAQPPAQPSAHPPAQPLYQMLQEPVAHVAQPLAQPIAQPKAQPQAQPSAQPRAQRRHRRRTQLYPPLPQPLYQARGADPYNIEFYRVVALAIDKSGLGYATAFHIRKAILLFGARVPPLDPEYWRQQIAAEMNREQAYFTYDFNSQITNYSLLYKFKAGVTLMSCFNYDYTMLRYYSNIMDVNDPNLQQPHRPAAGDN